jgi:hypothetical protein
MKPVKSLKTFIIICLWLIFTISSLNAQHPKDFVIPLTTSTTENPASISFSWNRISGPDQFMIGRKSKNSPDWGNRYALLPADATGYTDNNVETGVEYEYCISKTKGSNSIITYVNAGIKCKEVEYRGKVILLVDSTVVNDLKNELVRYETDLTGDGWDIIRKDISRSASVKQVKNIIRDYYNSDTSNVKTVILFGHIAVPYSGCDAYDGHPDHYGAWPADIYYGDMNEKIWTDVSADCTGASRNENHNVPSDGKFDVTSLPSDEKISLSVGRIDFYNLPAFPQTESELLKNYLNKNHNFRHKIIDPKLQSLVSDNFGGSNDGAFAISGWRNFTALLNASNVKSGEYLSELKKESYICSYACGPGAYTGCTGVGFTSDFVKQSSRTVFTCLFGSYFGDWDSRDNFMRSALASKGWILTSMWSGFQFYTFHQMGMGETIGSCLRTTQNNINTYDQNDVERHVNVSMQGDPTLRFHIVGPVSSLKSAITADNSVLLAWKPADDSILGYYVYKLDTLENRYIKITPSPVTDTWFEDESPVTGNNYYMVKSFKLSQVASGSYYNLSQGVFDTINYKQQSPVAVTGISISINQGNILPLKIYYPFTVDATVSPDNATNKLLKWSVENITGKGRIDVTGAIFPEKAGLFAVTAESLDGSGIKGRLEILVDSIPDSAGAITGEINLCRDSKRIFYSVPEIRGATTYIWTLPNGIIDTSSANEIMIVSDSNFVSGNIKVFGHNIYADGIESKLWVTMNEITPSPHITLVRNELHSNAQSGNQWYLKKDIIQNATDSVYIPEQEGIYYAKVTLNGCPSLMSNIISYKPTGIELTNSKEEIFLFPNPSAGRFTISFGADPVRKTTIKIFNFQGIQIYSEMFQNTSKAGIDLNAFPKGMYLVKVITNDTNFKGKVCME